MCEICEFQRLQIEALKKENEKLKQVVIRKESSLKQFLKRIQDHINNPDFHKPILSKNYDESNRKMA